MGGTPNKGTSKDMRLKENKKAATKSPSTNLFEARKAKMPPIGKKK